MYTKIIEGTLTMSSLRIFSAVTLSLLFLFASGFSPQILARTSKPIITTTGQKVSFTDSRNRLTVLLHELGEPKWTSKELKRMTQSVHSYLSAFSGRQYDKTLAALQRGDRYRSMIRAKLARAKIPLAFEALPMAESAYRFDARSKAGAVGLWQFMPASARHYGLHVGKKLDERTDPARATDAGVKYLKFLYKKFAKTSVLLSVAAYNAGEGRIARVIRKSGLKRGERGYSHVLRHLPKETRGYVPEFLAAALILKDPEHFGFPVTKHHPYNYIQIVQPLPIKKIARITKLSVTTVQQLNPELKKYGRTPTNNFIVRLPTKAALRLHKENSTSKVWKPATNPIAFTPPGKKTQVAGTKSGSHIVYTIRQGNHLQGIAKMFGVSIEDIRKKNSIQGNKIWVGQSLIIPGSKTLEKKIYRVKSGDNLGQIARRLGVPVQHLKFANGVSNPRRLRPGQKLIYYV
jgi:membrane-bound lytic murein transglycosylase D